MKSGEVIANGEWVTLQIKIDGIDRRIAVTREAIEDHLATDVDDRISMDDQCEFVRAHLAELTEAARRKIDITPKSEVIVIRSGDMRRKRQAAAF